MKRVKQNSGYLRRANGPMEREQPGGSSGAPRVETTRSFSLSTPLFTMGFSWRRSEHPVEEQARITGPLQAEPEPLPRPPAKPAQTSEARMKREAIRRRQLAALLLP